MNIREKSNNNYGNPYDLLDAINEIANRYLDLEKTREIEKTNRANIEAEKIKTITRIEAQKELFLKYMDKSFDERSKNFSKFFEVVDVAIRDNDTQKLALALNSINQLAAESPFKALLDINQLSYNLDQKRELDI